jgi:putative ABC transport system permease protein
MSPWELVRSALEGIGTNLTRAALTLLGVLIGVGSVILLMGVGTGAGAAVSDAISGLGTSLLTVSPGSAGSLSSQELTAATVQALESDSSEAVAAVVPVVNSSATAAAAGESTNASVIGTTAAYFDVTNSPVAQGTAFTELDQTGSRRVAVLGANLALNLFGAADPVGQTITLGSTPFLVNGVLKIKDAMGSAQVNTAVIIPLSRAERSITGYGPLSQIIVQAASPEAVGQAAADVTVTVAADMGVTLADANFTVTTQAELLSAREEVGTTLTAMLTAIAAISLVVGGIGVTNVMLVTVSERTREIGIRKAMGARNAAIWGQFVLEATILSLAGGALGVAGALALSNVQIMGTRPVITGGSILLAAGVSVAVGVFFGAYPALRAAALAPVEALRHE